MLNEKQKARAREAQRRYVESHPDRVAEYKRKRNTPGTVEHEKFLLWERAYRKRKREEDLEGHRSKQRVYGNRYSEKHPRTRRNAWYVRNYRITLDEYEGMLAKQEGRCAICGIAKQRMVVDHCHSTGNVRGILCSTCNSGIGHLGDSADTIRAALEYVMRNAQTVEVV